MHVSEKLAEDNNQLRSAVELLKSVQMSNEDSDELRHRSNIDLQNKLDQLQHTLEQCDQNNKQLELEKKALNDEKTILISQQVHDKETYEILLAELEKIKSIHEALLSSSSEQCNRLTVQIQGIE